MSKIFARATLGVATFATLATVAVAPAEARRYGRGYHHRDSAGPAIVAGIAGLAIGAAIAGSRNDRRYDYDRRYYRDHGYYPRDGYYYRQNYRGYDDGYYSRCTTRRVWDRYERRRVLVRYCD